MDCDLRKIADQVVEFNDGGRIRVGQWLVEVSLKLPQSFRYKDGEKKDQPVDHFTELIGEFGIGGKKAVLEYVDGCYKMLDKGLESYPNK